MSQPLAGLKPHKIAALGMTKTFQNVALFGESTVLDNVLTAGLLRHDVDAAREDALKCLDRVGLKAIAQKQAGTLSFPERARIELARALCTGPKVLLLDEVMAALNPVEMQEIMDLIRSLRDEGMTLLMVTHEMNFARKVSDRVIFMHQGRVHEAGAPDELFANPQTAELRQFLSSIH